MKYHHRWSPGDALYRACRTGNADLMRTTVRKGADVNAVDDSAARAASAGGELADGGDGEGGYFVTPLMLAAENGYAELVDDLVAEGALVEVTHTWSAGATNAAANSMLVAGDLEIVDLDFEDAADVGSYSQTLFDEDGEAFREKSVSEMSVDDNHDSIGPRGPASPLPGEADTERTKSSGINMRLSAAVAAAAAGQLVILRKLVLEHGADVALECGFHYGDETPLLAAAHNGRDACVEFLLSVDGARARLPEALEHACFAPSCFRVHGDALPSDLWWIPSTSSRPSTGLISLDTTAASKGSSSTSSSFGSLPAPSNKPKRIKKGHVSASVPEPCQRRACCQRLFTEVCAAGRLHECMPYFRHAWNEITMRNSQDPGLDGMGVPSAPLVIANFNLGFLYESLSRRGPGALLEAARLYGKQYTQARRLFGSNDEISLTARGDWGACLLRVTSSDDPGTGTPEAVMAAGLIGEGEPLLRDALRDLRALRPSLNATNDPRIARWESILLPLQPGRRPFEPMLFLTQQEDDPHFKSPTRLEHAMRGWRPGDVRVPFPSEEQLYPPLNPFQDELAKMKEILFDLNEVIIEDARILQQEGPEAENAVRAILIAAVKKNWRALVYADVKWRQDRQVVTAAAGASGRSIQAADIRFRDDHKIAEIAVRQDWRAFKYLTPRLKRKKKLFQIAKKSLMKTIQHGDWHALGQADSMLRGDIDVVDLANQISDESAMCYADRYVLAENQSWALIWPKFRRRCRRRLLWTSCIVVCLSSLAILTWAMVFIVLVDSIWPPVDCQYSELKMRNVTNEDGYIEEMEVYREWFKTYEYGYVCNRSLYKPPPEPEFQEIDDTTVANERREAEELIKEEIAKEEEEKSRRRFRHRRHLVRKRRQILDTLQTATRKKEQERIERIARATMANEENQKQIQVTERVRLKKQQL